MQPSGNLVADTICRTAEIGLTITGAADAGTLTIIDATPVAVATTCPECGHPGTKRDHVVRTLVDLPVVGFPTRLHVRVPRFLCTMTSCPRKIFQASLACADDRSKLTHRVTRWVLQRLAIDWMSVSTFRGSGPIPRVYFPGVGPGHLDVLPGHDCGLRASEEIGGEEVDGTDH